ncbi:endonuclease [Thermovibrio ammonificans]
MAGLSIAQLLQVLLEHFGPQNWWPAETPFEVCVGAVLTQNTTWENASRAVGNLKKANLLTPEALSSTDEGELQNLIKPAGFFRQKARYLKELSRFVVREGGIEGLKAQALKVLRPKLLNVKGIGPETADSILLYALDKPSFVVDKYTKRLLYRLGVLEGESVSYNRVKALVEGEIPPTEEHLKEYKELHALIVELCKRYCKTRPNCRECPLRELCYNQHNP